MRAKVFSSATILIFFISSFSSAAQETIDEQFEDFYENQTSSWEEYQLIKRPRLKSFWQVASDTIKTQKQTIASERKKVSRLSVKIDTLSAQIIKLESTLAESEAFNEQISFLGIDVNKSAYNIVVWAIIVGLAFAVGTVYLMFVRSNSITQKSQKAYAALEREFDEHKNKSRENQAKIKRELQTALNTLHENRISM